MSTLWLSIHKIFNFVFQLILVINSVSTSELLFSLLTYIKTFHEKEDVIEFSHWFQVCWVLKGSEKCFICTWLTIGTILSVKPTDDFEGFCKFAVDKGVIYGVWLTTIDTRFVLDIYHFGDGCVVSVVCFTDEISQTKFLKKALAR